MTTSSTIEKFNESEFITINSQQNITVLSQESEWKAILMREAKNLTALLDSVKTEVTLKTSQLDQLKSDFKHNLQLLKERDAAIAENEKAIFHLQKCLFERDVLLSEIKASVDRCEEELQCSKTVEANIREELERTRNEYCKREISLHEKHTEELNVMKRAQILQQESHSKEVAKLHSDINMQRLQITMQLEATVADADNRVNECNSRSSQDRFALDLRIKLLEEMQRRITNDKEMLQKDIESKDTEINRLRSQLVMVEQQAESLALQVDENISGFTTAKHENITLDAMYQQEIKQHEEEKEMFTQELGRIRTQLNWNRNEVGRLSNHLEEVKSVYEGERQKLLEQVAREEKKTDNIMSALKEAEAAKVLAERSARSARSECDRLRKDLEISLSSSIPVKVVDDKVTARDLKNAAELQCMRENNQNLEHENFRLKQVIAIMSQQAKQTEQHLNKRQFNDIGSTLPPGAPLTSEESQVKSLEARFKHAVSQIQRLVQEKYALTELSNRLQAKVHNLAGPQLTSFPNGEPTIFTEIEKVKDVLTNSSDSGRQSKSTQRATPHRCQDFDDALSSVGGGDSVSAVFKLLDDMASVTGESK